MLRIAGIVTRIADSTHTIVSWQALRFGHWEGLPYLYLVSSSVFHEIHTPAD